MSKNEEKAAFRRAIISSLLALGRTDTLYRDLYDLRARFYLQEEITHEEYRALKRMETSLASLPNQIRNSMNRGDWREVRELSSRYKIEKEELARKKDLRQFAREIYETQDVPIDPFSPGMYTIVGSSPNRLAQLRSEAMHQLKELMRNDSEWKPFYSRRLTAFDALSTDVESRDAALRPPASVLEDEAAKALDAGNIDRLEYLAEEILQSSEAGADSAYGAEDSAAAEIADYHFEFPPETLRRAEALGLQLHHVTSRHKEFAPLYRFAWHPTYSQMQGNHPNAQHLPDPSVLAGMPKDLQSRIQLFAIHPFINSAGVRFLPPMVGEDVLVESFADPEAGATMPKSGLLAALGLDQRNQLSRLQIEAILLEKGNTLLRDELDLDPFAFKLVCIPPDLHWRIGLQCGWGQQKIWTHFDGYMIMADGTLHALAGGDIRYGGIYDLLGISRNYDSDRVIARFAVVQRQRLATWQ